MKRMKWRRLACLVMLGFLLWPLRVQSAAADSIKDVDAAIVLAVDFSFSIDRGSALRQRDGHVLALRSKEVLEAIKSGPRGCIAIAYIEWAGSGVIRHVLPWTLVCNGAQAAEAARVIEDDAFSGRTRLSRRATSISYAIDAASLMLERFPGHATRKVIDISANGTNNDGVSVASSRSRALGRGHIINAIVLAAAEPGVTDDLPGYFRDNVIGGAGAFVMTPARPDDYPVTLLRKLVVEIGSVVGSIAIE